MRTPDQVKADDLLRNAIELAQAAYNLAPKAGVLTDYLICTVNQGFDDDGDDTTQIAYLVSSGQMPGYRALGLLLATQRVMEATNKAES